MNADDICLRRTFCIPSYNVLEYFSAEDWLSAQWDVFSGVSGPTEDGSLSEEVCKPQVLQDVRAKQAAENQQRQTTLTLPQMMNTRVREERNNNSSSSVSPYGLYHASQYFWLHYANSWGASSVSVFWSEFWTVMRPGGIHLTFWASFCGVCHLQRFSFFYILHADKMFCVFSSIC